MRRCYSSHGVRVREGDTVVDAGANVGLFTLFLLRGGAIRCACAGRTRQLYRDLKRSPDQIELYKIGVRSQLRLTALLCL